MFSEWSRAFLMLELGCSGQIMHSLLLSSSYCWGFLPEAIILQIAKHFQVYQLSTSAGSSTINFDLLRDGRLYHQVGFYSCRGWLTLEFYIWQGREQPDRGISKTFTQRTWQKRLRAVLNYGAWCFERPPALFV
jgi:hypothetical protein